MGFLKIKIKSNQGDTETVMKKETALLFKEQYPDKVVILEVLDSI